MKRRLVLPALFVFALSGCGLFTHNPASGSSSSADPLPAGFDFSMKRHTLDDPPPSEQDALTIHFFEGKLYISDKRDGNTEAYDLTPSREDWQSFWKAADPISLWQWKSEVDPGEPDFVWSLDMKQQDRENVVNGNHFHRGRDGSPSQGKEGWIVFTTALQRLIRHEIPILQESMQ
ncbi:hypothetical protein [Haloferula sp. BvORR071]|uniref:hypothetical protein n=1 Tax=Haloferula sp. BvORR071 TaxID=1396141 RepID=UPI0005511A17|nr:hypothetical protein [Haloferula sp. BvORR071]